MAARTYTFLFTDVVGSTALWEEDPAAMARACEAHDDLIRRCVEHAEGTIFKSLGDGWAAVFPSPASAVRCALAIQAELPQQVGLPLQVRVGVHTGIAEAAAHDFRGLSLNRVDRICGLAPPGGVLVSRSAYEVASESDPGLEFRPMGPVRLRGTKSPETVYLAVGPGAVASGEVGLTSKAKSNLPSPSGPFLGREEELGAVTRVLRSDEVQLVTLLGFGGVGKSTLALRTGESLQGEFADGIWWIEAESARDSDDLALGVAAAAGLALDPDDPVGSLADSLQAKEALLILDCLEGLIEDSSMFLDRILAACPDVKALATSRAVLGLPVEHIHEVHGLKRSRRGESPALRLFREHALRQSSSFVFGPAEQRIAKRLVERVEGIPLAVQLLAGRLRYRTLPEIEQDLERSFLETVRTYEAKPGRHSGLRQVIEASFRLIPDEDRAVAARAAVFAGPFTLSDAEAVIPGSTPAVARLRDQSLLQASPSKEAMRYRTLDSVREYLQFELDADARESVLWAHARHYILAATTIRQAFDQGDLKGALARLTDHIANLRLAFDTALEANQELAEAYASTLARPLFELGFAADFERILQTVEASAPPDLSRELTGLSVEHARRARDWGTAADRLRRLADLVAGTEGEADAVAEICSTCLMSGDLDGAEAALARFRTLDPQFRAPLERSVGLLQAKLDLDRGNREAAIRGARHAVAGTGVAANGETLFVWKNASEVLAKAGCREEGLAIARTWLRASTDAGLARSAGLALLFLREHEERSHSNVIIAALGAIPRAKAPDVAKTAARLGVPPALKADWKALAVQYLLQFD